MSSFLDRILKHPILSSEYVKELVARFQDGDVRAGNKVIEHNYRFIFQVARMYALPSKDYFIDVFTEGVIGFQHALSMYDPSKGVAFNSYAIWWVKNHISRYFLYQHNMFNITDSQLKTYIDDVNAGNIRVEEYLKLNEETPTEQIKLKKGRGRPKKSEQNDLKFSYNSLTLRNKIHQTHFVNLYDPTNPKSEGVDVIQDQNIEETFADKDLNGLIKMLTADLSPVYKDLLYMSHGVDGSGEDMNNSELRSAFNNISRERIRQKKLLAINKVKRRAERLGITKQVLLENLS